VRYTDPSGMSYSEAKMDSKNDSESGGTESNNKYNKSDLAAKGVERPDNGQNEIQLPGVSLRCAKVHEYQTWGIFSETDKGTKNRPGNPSPGSGSDDGRRRGPFVLVNRMMPIGAVTSTHSQTESNDFLSGKATWDDKAKTVPNTISRYGCLYTAVVNLVSHLRYQQVKGMLGDGVARAYSRLTIGQFNFEKYFNIISKKEGGHDVFMSQETIKAMIEDAVPGVKVNVTLYNNPEQARVAIAMANLQPSMSPDVAIIANVGGNRAVTGGTHFVNVLGLANGKLSVVETHPALADVRYSLDPDVRGIYFIEVIK